MEPGRLEHLLREYVEHYNARRPHRSLDQRARTMPKSSSIGSADRSDDTPPATDSSTSTGAQPKPSTTANQNAVTSHRRAHFHYIHADLNIIDALSRGRTHFRHPQAAPLHHRLRDATNRHAGDPASSERAILLGVRRDCRRSGEAQGSCAMRMTESVTVIRSGSPTTTCMSMALWR